MNAYILLKYVHIVLAIVAVGFNLSYAVWIARAAREPSQLLYVLQGVRVLDNRFANPAYGLLLLTGFAMVLVGNIALTTFWIAAALALYLLVLVIGVAVFAPLLRRQIEVLARGGPDTAEYRKLSARSTLIGMLTMIDVLLIVALMVFKPSL